MRIIKAEATTGSCFRLNPTPLLPQSSSASTQRMVVTLDVPGTRSAMRGGKKGEGWAGRARCPQPLRLGRGGRVVAVLAVALTTACGASDETRVARAIAALFDGIADRDVDAICAVAAPEYRQRDGGCRKAWADQLKQPLTPESARRFRAVEAARIVIDGNRATAYLRDGNCVVGGSDTQLRKTDRGWLIVEVGGVVNAATPDCLPPD